MFGFVLLFLLAMLRVFESALEVLEDRIRIKDPNGTVVFTNAAWNKQLKTRCRPSGSCAAEVLSLADGYTMELKKMSDEDEFVQKVFDAMPHMIWSATRDGMVDYFSKQFVEYAGLNVDLAIGHGWKEMAIVHPDDFEYCMATWLRSIQTMDGYETECRLRRDDGVYRWFLARAVPLYNPDGSFNKWYGTCTDIDNSKKTEENLRQAKANLHAERRLLDATLNQLPVGIIFARVPTGEIFYANSTAEQVWKQPVVPGQTLKDYSVWKAYHADGSPYRPEDFPVARSILKGEIVMNEDTQVVVADGTRRVMRISSSPVHDDKGITTLAVAICEDVTERIKMEELRTQLMAREQAALEASRLKSEFLRNVSHELRTPLAGLLGMADALLDDGNLTNEQRSCVDTIRESGKLLLLVLNDILDFSKVEAGKLELESTSFNLFDLFHHVDAMTQPTAKSKDIALITELNSSLPKYLIGDSGRLQQILINLVGNAVKFTKEGWVHIKVGGDRVGDGSFKLVFTVEDTGIGIPEKAMKRLFQPFMQADTSMTRRFGGSGLGLSICKSLLTLMKGAISVESKPDKGTKFTVTVTLPIGSEPCEPEKQMKPSPSFANAKFLVVEDNLVNQKLAIRVLKRLGATHIDVASNGLEALEHFKKLSYDVILMDCQMPTMDGYTATRHIRDLEMAQKLPRTAIVAVTAGAMKVDKDACLEAGMDAHVAKPFTAEDLQEVLRMFIY